MQNLSFCEKSYSIDSMMFGVGGGFNAGPFWLKANVYTGENVSALGSSEAEAPTAIYNAAGDCFEDAETLGYMLVLGFKASDMLKFEAGYGATSHEMDNGTVDIDDATGEIIHAFCRQEQHHSPTSSGRATRFRGLCPRMASPSGPESTAAAISVSTNPGATAYMKML